MDKPKMSFWCKLTHSKVLQLSSILVHPDDGAFADVVIFVTSIKIGWRAKGNV